MLNKFKGQYYRDTWNAVELPEPSNEEPANCNVTPFSNKLCLCIAQGTSQVQPKPWCVQHTHTQTHNWHYDHRFSHSCSFSAPKLIVSHAIIAKSGSFIVVSRKKKTKKDGSFFDSQKCSHLFKWAHYQLHFIYHDGIWKDENYSRTVAFAQHLQWLKCVWSTLINFNWFYICKFESCKSINLKKSVRLRYSIDRLANNGSNWLKYVLIQNEATANRFIWSVNENKRVSGKKNRSRPTLLG